jgi:glyoxalase family protein
MNATPDISGIHHITAVSSNAARNLYFYTEVLGLRLVKQTVNFDNPHTYHLYYGDRKGHPGTILTFFPWEDLPRGRPGAGAVTALAFAVPREAVYFWRERLNGHGVRVKMEDRFGDPVLRFADPDGLPLELVGEERPAIVSPWERSPIPEASAIRGVHSATATVNDLAPEATLVAEVMGMRPVDQEKGRYRYRLDDWQSPGRWFDLKIDASARLAKFGSGVFHHIAFRTADDGAQAQWQEILAGSGRNVSGVRDRNYFRSIYFHTPAGILFEMATDAPGFVVDEPVGRLGGSLQLPEQYEGQRREILKHLPPLCEEAWPCTIDHVLAA